MSTVSVVDIEAGSNFYVFDGKNEIKYTVLENYGEVMHSDDHRPRRKMIALLLKTNYTAVYHFDPNEVLNLQSRK